MFTKVSGTPFDNSLKNRPYQTLKMPRWHIEMHSELSDETVYFTVSLNTNIA